MSRAWEGGGAARPAGAARAALTRAVDRPTMPAVPRVVTGRVRRTRARRCAVAVVIAGLGLLAGAALAEGGVLYRLGRCSSVTRPSCVDCEPERVQVSGGFLLLPVPGDTGSRVASFELRNLALAFGDLEVHGRGLLLLDGDRASVLAELDSGEGLRVVFGSGTVPRGTTGALRIDHLIVGGARFDLHATPADPPDDDCDGVVDADDLCPATACDAAVDRSGCGLDQTCPCVTRADGRSWSSHRDYVRCVIAASRRLLADGRLDADTRAEVVEAAAGSLCGRSALASLDGRGR
jgi:hypothetical protein